MPGLHRVLNKIFHDRCLTVLCSVMKGSKYTSVTHGSEQISPYLKGF